MCNCGHEAWDHNSIPDPNRSGLLGSCRRCACDQYSEEGLATPQTKGTR